LNEELANAAKNVGDAQLSIIKKTTEEAGRVLLNPFGPLIDIAKNAKKYYDDLMAKLRDIAWPFVLGVGAVFGFMLGLPFWLFIRRIRPKPRA
jgi:hypothetical protein